MHLVISTTAWGWAAVIGSIFAFGSFAVPIKSKRVLDAKVDPLVYQSYKSFWACITSVIPFTYTAFSYTPWGIISGLLWIPGGVCAIVAINCIGLGVAMGFWSGIIVMGNFFFGVVVFREPLHNVPLAIGGVVLLSVGVAGMALASAVFKPPVASHGNVQRPRRLSITQTINEADPLLPSGEITEVNFFQAMNPRKRAILGWFCTVMCGCCGALFNVPYKIASNRGSSSIDYLFSFATGVALVNSSALLFYTLFRLLYLKKKAPSFHFRIMAIPGSISGILWSLGNYLSIYGIMFLGQSIAGPSVQAGLVVSGLWGILLYRELKGLQIVIWAISAVLAMSGIVLLGQAK
eukprot:TRINITY_DN3260_c0_g1_i1.p1 TRINITY_DN3260_c0_g1~~TRINITY_DN3260_c0_g1_i1.p1  ORF type:complete len:349 (+),score=8.01 TRINITY_DN3260_c0_g1_i1:84-1130(+)